MFTTESLCAVGLLLIATAGRGLAQQCAFSGSCYYNRDIRKSVPCAVEKTPTETLSDSLWTEFKVSFNESFNQSIYLSY